uniref:Wall-associated receptor kinase-like 14 n=1 Tax=Populus alba TaxID=43335 RepID=A0A4U5PYP8_POPAL|nr:wall-associated receptor kinase-like 14 [Populus alba]
MILQQESLVLFITIITIFIAATSSPTQKSNSSACESSCGTGKSVKVVPYPFGFSGGCPIILQCDHTAGDVKIGEFHVQNITPNVIVTNILADCNRSIARIKPLFGKNFAPSLNNSLLLQNCNKTLNSCVIPTSSLRRDLKLANCGDQNYDLNCYSQRRRGFDTLRYENMTSTTCKSVFSSLFIWWEGSAVSFQFERFELEWWLEGDYNTLCSNNANHTKVKLSNGGVGLRCHCADGFAGDGFAAGKGCRKGFPVSKCSASKYMSGECGGTTRVGVLVGGFIAGALLMAGLAFLCFYIRRKSTSLRNRLSAKRLLCEAAGNSSVPFFQYKDIEKATNGFSEKQRLGIGAYVDFSRPHSEVNLAALAIDRIGRGCVDEIIDPYLDPNRDAWTLTSILSVAELAFRCLAFHRDMRPTMLEVAEELEQIRLSAWIPTMYMASPTASSCSSQNGSQKSLSVSISRKAGLARGKLLLPQRTDSLTSLEETKDSSPVSEQDTWLSEQSSPSTNSLLGNVVR